MDDGKKVNLLPYQVFQVIKTLKESLVRDQMPMKGIREVPIQVKGKVKLLLTLGTPLTAQTQYTQFLVVKLPLMYNAILGQKLLGIYA